MHKVILGRRGKLRKEKKVKTEERGKDWGEERRKKERERERGRVLSGHLFLLR